MKKKLLSILLLSIIFYSCQKEDPINNQAILENEAFNAWLHADLSLFLDQEEMNYPIDNKRLYELSTIKDVTDIQFMPSVMDGKFLIRVMAVNSNTDIVLAEERLHQNSELKITSFNKNNFDQGSEVANIKNNEDVQNSFYGETIKYLRSKLLTNKKTESLIATKTNYNQYLILNPTLHKEIQDHRLSYSQATNYLNNWKQKSIADIEEITPINGQRIRYISYPPILIQHIATLPSEYTNITWRIDKEHKLTTVLTPVSTNRNEQLEVFDAGKQCPPFCLHCD